MGGGTNDHPARSLRSGACAHRQGQGRSGVSAQRPFRPSCRPDGAMGGVPCGQAGGRGEHHDREGGVVNAWPAWSLRFIGEEWAAGASQIGEVLRTGREYLGTTPAIRGAFRIPSMGDKAACRRERAGAATENFSCSVRHHLLADDIFPRSKLQGFAKQILPNPVPTSTVSVPLDLTCRVCPVRDGQGQTGRLPDNPVPSHIHGHHCQANRGVVLQLGRAG